MKGPRMKDARLQRVVDEWRSNRRLRLGALAIVLVLGAHAVLALADGRHAREQRYARDAELLGRLEEASRESAWPARAAAAEGALAAMRHSIPAARSDGLAQAEMQAWLTDLAAFAGLVQPGVRVETSLAVPGQADMWQVLARLDATASPATLPVLVRALASAMPWVRTEHLELIDGGERVSLIVRGYFRAAGAGDAKDPAPRPGGIPAANQAANPGGAAATAAAVTGAASTPFAGVAGPGPQGATPAGTAPRARAAGGSVTPSAERYPGLTPEQRKALNPRRKRKQGDQ